MKFISLFAGIGGLDLGLERAGMECVAQVEIDDFCQKVLTKHWANVPKFKDVRDVGKHNLPTADLICGGFPCQDVSMAGKRAGLEGKRTTLWTEYHRIICEIRPKWILAENVPGLLSSDNGQFFGKVLRDLDASGYHAEWQSVSALLFGASHTRERVFIVGYPASRYDNCGEIFTKDFLQALSGAQANTYHPAIQGRPNVGAWVQATGYTWENAARVRGMDDGVSARLDRLKSLGNAVVPQVAEFLGNVIMKAETCLTPREPDKGDSPDLQALSTLGADSALGDLS